MTMVMTRMIPNGESNNQKLLTLVCLHGFLKESGDQKCGSSSMITSSRFWVQILVPQNFLLVGGIVWVGAQVGAFLPGVG